MQGIKDRVRLVRNNKTVGYEERVKSLGYYTSIQTTPQDKVLIFTHIEYDNFEKGIDIGNDEFIYVNDIIECKAGTSIERGVVKFQEGSFIVDFEKHSELLNIVLVNPCHSYSIVGNIREDIL